MGSGQIVNLFMVYQFLKRLVTPFDQWDAYKTGVIDEKGNILLKPKDRHTLDQKRSFGKFDVLVLRLKKLLAKVPGGSTRLASYAAALLLIKEDWKKYSEDELNGLPLDRDLNIIMESLEEEGIANVAGAGNIAGMGYKGKDDVKVSPRAAKRYKKRNRLDADKLNRAFEDYDRTRADTTNS